MKFRSIHKVHADAEATMLGQMSLEEYQDTLKSEMALSLAKKILETNTLPLMRYERGTEIFYEWQCVVLTKADYDNILTLLNG